MDVGGALRLPPAPASSHLATLALLHFPTTLRLARVIDGATIEVAGERIRLHGIDAPESGQRCRRLGHARG